MADGNPGFNSDHMVTKRRKQSKGLYSDLQRTIHIACVRVCADLRIYDRSHTQYIYIQVYINTDTYTSLRSSVFKLSHIRKQKLDQRKFKIHNKSTTLDQCGHFDEKYVEALKGEHRRFTNRA
jgi:hypothetical protein